MGVSRDCPNFFGTPIISGMGKATDFKFGKYIQRVHPNFCPFVQNNKSPLKILEKRERGRFQRLPNFLRYPLLSQERVQLRTSNFACTFIGSIGTKPIKKFWKVAVGVVRDSRKFSGHPYIGRIARSSLRYLSFLVDEVSYDKC